MRRSRIRPAPPARGAARSWRSPAPGPTSSGRSAPSSPMRAAGVLPEPRMSSVLIVEDDRDTREMLARFLELEGFEVREAANGQVALEALRADAGTCVILLDLM